MSELAAAAVEDPDRHRFLSVELIRQRNKVANALHEAATAVERVLPGTDG